MLIRISLLVLSSLCLILAFPKFDLFWLVWVALIPLLFSLKNQSLRRSFWLSVLCGFIFNVGMFYWIAFVTSLGMLALCLYFSLYFGLFGIGVYLLRNEKVLQKSVLLACWWVVLEYLRSHLLTGFSWASLGHSQYENLALIQFADITGVAGVSFLIVVVNVIGQDVLNFVGHKNVDFFKYYRRSIMILMGLFCLIFFYGSQQIKKYSKITEQMPVAVIQPNIDQTWKFSPSTWPQMMEQLMELTVQAAEKNPALIIWPETAFPGTLVKNDLESNFYYVEMQEFMKRINIPVVYGVVWQNDEEYYNAAALHNNKDIQNVYHKKHLVPFGEFIPLRSLFPFLDNFIPIEDFSVGTENTLLFSKKYPDHLFGVLICFEDTVSHMARAMTLEGAKFLVNMTNDGWFRDTKEPYMHLQVAVFQSIQNRRDLIRSANTGISGLIANTGAIQSLVKNSSGKSTYISGVSQLTVQLNDKITWYTKFGEAFAYLCFGAILMKVFLINKNKS